MFRKNNMEFVNTVINEVPVTRWFNGANTTKTDPYSEKLKKMKEDIIKNFDELSSTDLMEQSRIAREIVDKRLAK